MSSDDVASKNAISSEKPTIGDKIKHAIGLDKNSKDHKDKESSSSSEHNTFTEVKGKTSGAGVGSSGTVPATTTAEHGTHSHAHGHGHEHSHSHGLGTNKTIDPTSHAARDADHVPAVAYGTGSGSGTGPRAGESGSEQFAKEVQERGVEDVIHHGSSRTAALDAPTGTHAGSLEHGSNHHHHGAAGHTHGHGLTGAGVGTGAGLGAGTGAGLAGAGATGGVVGSGLTTGSGAVGSGPGTHTVTYGKDGDPSYGSTHTSAVGSGQQLFDGSNIDQTATAGSGLNVRPLHSNDHEHGYLDVLLPLVPSQPPLTRAIFDESFAEMHATNSRSPRPIYHVVVVEDLSPDTSSSERILATATLLLERKFLRAGSVAGHIEDVSVRSSAQGRGLGRLLIDTLTNLAAANGCYKVILDCDDRNVAFYEKCTYTRAGVEMKRYL